MKCIFGLGNPGLRYRNNKHNIGYKVVETFAKAHKSSFKRNAALGADTARVTVEAEDIVLIKPRTFMNNSGVCVRKTLASYPCSFSDILVIYDDADLPLGVLRFRRKGSAGGHRGMASIIEIVGEQQIQRLKIGIGRTREDDLAGYVLSDFSRKEKSAIDEGISQAVAACSDWVRCGMDYVMRKYNKR